MIDDALIQKALRRPRVRPDLVERVQRLARLELTKQPRRLPRFDASWWIALAGVGYAVAAWLKIALIFGS